MREGFKSIEIEPTEGYLNFIGPAKSTENANEPAKVLKGQVRFSLTKPTKIRNMSVKFKGFSHVSIQQTPQLENSTPLLPKLKLPLSGKATLPAGDHVIPWELDILNIYPRSLLIKRATINYKVIVSISIGLTKTITAEYPIVILRHLLPYKELAPIIETKIFKQTIPGKFHYEIDAPQIVCLEQEHIPLAIKYISFTNHKSVKYIRTRLVQIELYRRQSLSKSDIDLSASNQDSHIFDLDKKLADANHFRDTHLKFIKRTVPALLHIPDSSASTWKRPCLVRHKLHPYLSYTLDSPLVSIYHQMEVTFQFGQKYEEIKVKIPVIVASIPKRESSAMSTASDEIMMKYAFEEVAQPEYLPYQLEPKYASVTEDDLSPMNDDSFSILRDTGALSPTTEEQGGRITPMMFASQRSPLPPPFNRATSPNTPQAEFQRSLTPEPNYIQNYHLKKFASALDLSTTTSDSSCSIPNPHEEERPRTTTPTTRRQLMPRKNLTPINIDLANRKNNNRGTPVPPPDIPPPPIPTSNTLNSNSDSSDVLPATDRMTTSRNTNYNNTTHKQPQSNRKNKIWGAPTNDDTSDDLRSIYSDSSITSANAPSLSSSATLSTNKSHPTLHSRPPSPVFSPAPGLPATIALRPQELQTSQVEELFSDNATAMSPMMNTVASSTVLSPRTSYALRRRIALSTISSLTNDSIGASMSMMSRGARSSSTVDPDMQSFIRSRYSDNSYDSTPPVRYINARLPPLPSNANKRLTKIYLDDSDDEEEETPELPLFTQNTMNNLSLQDVGTPPRLPRLSFGGDFQISLGI